ncbi:PREDICTED: protein phosphatase 1 regulatory subunit 35 isoform X1 [Colobus angolensis palliatus]|uniref:protein phosphatase 1 regulatory subunit 35 isoform X1 n=1 Tax=Colobus angolensis palliatus TaxID=336983 RepID=UPI0005F54ACE|nr:PREDICTED: protein phosphatase 1 regulatory subunit 35 isoform X1 [Colobus angolensis palliatus]
MRGCGESELELADGEEAAAVSGPPPEPRAPEPRAPLPEPGLDLSLSPRPDSPEPRHGSPGRRKGRGVHRGAARQRRQVRFRLTPPSPVRSKPQPAVPQELEMPVLQSSLALGLELRATAGSHFDAAKAVEEQLRKSFQIRCGLEESVSEGLNVPRSKRLFRDLVSLQVPEEQVLNAALREKLALLPPQTRAPPPKVMGSGRGASSMYPLTQILPECNLALGPTSQQEPPGPGPDMTILCDPETLFYESPHLTLDGLSPLRLQLRPRPSEDTFLMHRTLRRWEA